MTHIRSCLRSSLSYSQTVALVAVFCLLGAAGCEDNTATLRKIQQQKQARMEATSKVDHLRDTYLLFGQLGESNLEAAAAQVRYHLNAWQESQAARSDSGPDSLAIPESLVATWDDALVTATVKDRMESELFLESDVEHFRLQYLLHRISDWALDGASLDPWLQERLDAESLDETESYDLGIACQYFDWVIRNVQLEPQVLGGPAPAAPRLSAGLQFRGPGYRQTSWETLWRGSGDAWQRSDLFLQLCRQAGLDACLLAVPQGPEENLQPWLTAVRIGDQLYLFDAELGLAVPGPDEKGIATLAEAQQDPTILRRLRVPGLFEYPFTSQQIQNCVALLDANPELLSNRMKRLEEGFTGDRRMSLSLDAAGVAERIGALDGISAVQLWQVPLQAMLYQQGIAEAMRDDLALNQWYYLQWGIFDRQSQLYPARWHHLEGLFDDDPEANIKGARVQYMKLRSPEFELEDLNMDIQLQMEYGLRRAAGEAEADHRRRVLVVQEVMRAVKRTATFWIALMHVEEGRWETAEKWLKGRVLEDPQAGRWYPSARYNLGRVSERLGDLEQAEAMYKTNGYPQEQGNRIRARSLDDEE
ncbi:hypothetical protein FF011L_13630 [Roseimaritima multifibrata]|uniref:Tetratricopeptide repeat protein n=1 Tax=Roseimaritima multifibrata TaxID=1930274 RepID=A0A517MCR6_9BACT|nr:hypothetical protein [Roseimaritima multifibrata]QDS92616.1 hypothetical protein FF011L_13630 [Roseimaritima multifibrata]